MNAHATHTADAATVEEGLAIQQEQSRFDSQAATDLAMQNTLLTPRFYTTDFDELDRVDVSPVRSEWDALLAQMKSDPNKGHFRKTEEWDEIDWEGMDPELKDEFLDFLVSSCTAEFSGCVLYKEMKRRGNNPDICQLFSYMSRDEARHAGFINDALREAGVAVNLGFLTREKKYTFFRPKFIYYATYLSEKIGYARYITIYRHLEANPDKRFHPIFKWFREWCNDEFSHGEAFALLMRTDPKLTHSLRNRLWIRFFLAAVYSTMWVRDHARPKFHEALGVDIDWYDMEVFRKTNAIARQVFPVELDIEHPRFRRGCERMNRAAIAMDAAKRKGGVAGALGRARAGAAAALAFASLYTLPVKKNDVPRDVRMEPAY
ncbi:magnesium-protoporphyrin IX monomethyl ester (oxidative) cyclase [Palleronia sp. LCG004]|uniref:magnesium-protoporphyrin IX monomethyl ester (oxidative) cyclase n=1 Tax=Palleronia sp. LCG004 TaxID=3079304 RepID=UPI0029430996|nr:magnesium-protoporphyrin IX monomethyl ester (oxidative) cyclase [Palleronia sp. LCG004]WOI56170.1 magnesium-protoporphyrin IX monomethyl ester (oxidative) cyclase [Palleronia sp. LCG004]